ncbi:PLP-dependent aminotransferase family protein [Nocardia sp. NPDC051570]|uniref:PLP-dependent aminotransferase family protein n=1 Tax=Nocardia sp. NPDC051570 TaxID=3364324 RepID=UPI003794CAD8
MIPLELSRGAAAVRSGAIDDLHATLTRRPDIVSFAVGAPDLTLLPPELFSGLAADALGKFGSSILQYGSTRGFAPLLERSRTLLRQRSIDCPTDRIHIATGGSGALHNVCMALLDPGDVVLVETPTYGPAIKAFRGHRATVVGVESDRFGILPDALDDALDRHAAAFVYLLPTFQNPTGRTMPAQRRAQVAEVIRRRDALVIEDDVYADLRYRGEPVPALYSFAPDNSIYITSLSKTLAPALRIGITVMREELLQGVLPLKESIDMQTSTFCQAIAAEFLDSETGSAHLARVVETYSMKLDILTNALEKYMPRGFHWVKPDGGMFVWVDGPPDFDADEVARRGLEHGVAFLPGSIFHADDRAGRNSMRLSFAGVPANRIDRGIELLADLCGEFA